MKTRILISLLAIVAISPSFAASFDESFADSTLRIDYIFGGGPCGKVVLLDSQTKTPGWFGKRHRLSELPLEGNGSIVRSSQEAAQFLLSYGQILVQIQYFLPNLPE